MLTGSQMADALIAAGLVDAPTKRKSRKRKTFKCNVCGAPMTQPEWGNFMFCEKCDKPSFFVFSENRGQHGRFVYEHEHDD